VTVVTATGALASLLAACASKQVAVEPVALPPVAAALMQTPSVPRCELPVREDYDTREVLAYAHCWRVAYFSSTARLYGLQKAVGVREKAAAKAVAVRG
jgi:hypothetical protein